MADFLVIFPALFELLLQLFLALGRGGHLTGILAVVDHILHTVDFAFIDPLHTVEIVDPDIAGGVRRVAVQIGQRLEAALFAAVEQPVNGALLINFAVVGKEIFQKVIADDLTGSRTFVAQSLCDEVQILLQRVRTVDLFEPSTQ